MLIAGFQKTSFVDYPKRIAAVVFTPYCTMRCVYCHNRHILGRDAEIIDECEVMEYLEKRSGMLDAVVITGGEPTLRQDLPDFIADIRQLGYLVKLDTNGTNPDMLLRLINEKQLDYIAMDIKAPFEKYDEITCCKNDLSAIHRSITIIMNSGVDYEFRTTFPPQLSPDDIATLAGQIKGAKKYCVQQYRKVTNDDPEPLPPSTVRLAAQKAQEILGIPVEVRGL